MMVMPAWPLHSLCACLSCLFVAVCVCLCVQLFVTWLTAFFSWDRYYCPCLAVLAVDWPWPLAALFHPIADPVLIPTCTTPLLTLYYLTCVPLMQVTWPQFQLLDHSTTQLSLWILLDSLVKVCCSTTLWSASLALTWFIWDSSAAGACHGTLSLLIHYRCFSPLNLSPKSKLSASTVPLNWSSSTSFWP
jgi:hypothetical protein